MKPGLKPDLKPELKIVTWNVNSVRARKERVLDWLERTEPDVVCLQETKVTDDKFPREEFEARGYQVAIHGQRTYNGVAILSKQAISDVRRGMRNDASDEQARLIAARTCGITAVSAYFPNGSEPTSPKFAYKLEWMARLRAELAQHWSDDEPLVLCGDFNVAPHDSDAADPEKWRQTVLCRDDVRAALAEIEQLGFTDVVQQHHPDGGLFSWWDYRMLAFPKNDGLRIDHVFANATLAKRSIDAGVERDERKGKGASDHAPVWASFRTAG